MYVTARTSVYAYPMEVAGHRFPGGPTRMPGKVAAEFSSRGCRVKNSHIKSSAEMLCVVGPTLPNAAGARAMCDRPHRLCRARPRRRRGCRRTP